MEKPDDFKNLILDNSDNQMIIIRMHVFGLITIQIVKLIFAFCIPSLRCYKKLPNVNKYVYETF